MRELQNNVAPFFVEVKRGTECWWIFYRKHFRFVVLIPHKQLLRVVALAMFIIFYLAGQSKEYNKKSGAQLAPRIKNHLSQINYLLMNCL
jgi:hypothetical protein